MRERHPISVDFMGCCVCLNETGQRGRATHIVSEAGRKWTVCESHLDAQLPPKPTKPTRKAT